MALLISLLVFSLVLGLSFKNLETEDKSKRRYLFIMFGLMAIFAGFRANSVGLDTANYAYAYSYIRNNGIQGIRDLSFQYEWGYLILNYIVGKLFKSPNALFLIISITTCGLFARTFYKYSHNVVMSTFLFIIWFFPSTLNTMRQYLALAIVLAGVPMLVEKKMVKYLLFVLLATLIHNTAIIFAFFAIFALKKIHLNIRVIILSSLIALVSLNFFDLLLSLFLKNFNQYERFLESAKYSATTTMDTLWIVFYLLVAVVYIYYLYKEEKSIKVKLEKQEDVNESLESMNRVEMEYFFCILFIISIVCMVFSSRLWIVTRLNSYFRFSICLILPFAVKSLDRLIGKYKVLAHPVFYAAFGYLGYSMFLVDGHRILPFLFFWS